VFRQALTRQRGRPEWVGLAIVDPATGELAGNIAGELEGDGTAEVSYWVAASARGRGLAGRAVEEFCGLLAQRWPGCVPVLWTHADNTASQRVAERAGFRHQPERDEQRVIAGRSWPIRWYVRD
jgi:ribosomal-protein-alanine N-acetyltransferase